MSQNNEIQYSFSINTELSTSQLRKLEVSLMRVLSYVERFTGGNPNLTKLISMMQATITTIRTLQAAIRALEIASGPIGWLYAGTSIVAAGFAGYSILEATTGT